MSIVRRNNIVFPSLMNEILKPDWFGGLENMNVNLPAVNIKENEKDYELELSVPGRKKEDFNIEVDNKVLTVSSDVNTEKDISKENYTRKEFSFTSFKRSFTLPETIDEEKIEANYEDGILKFVFPKKAEALPKAKRLISLK
ncbi:Hsp20/alpha crystallin family protein [Aurantibacter crassamenti]|uniref:Hsp20/alpha crystallin family protein n=1 Tax=Aurantibacter crassamenti TaxID=1837375 RepID=UPI001939B416|nr:Hsp20/alpha crystallin family protein [Aurantibacter crassamenti]MBM1106418.1 Hsp20/alpha crystallin family protein [Aurantibacter crassamenti]